MLCHFFIDVDFYRLQFLAYIEGTGFFGNHKRRCKTCRCFGHHCLEDFEQSGRYK